MRIKFYLYKVSNKILSALIKILHLIILQIPKIKDNTLLFRIIKQNKSQHIYSQTQFKPNTFIKILLQQAKIVLEIDLHIILKERNITYLLLMEIS